MFPRSSSRFIESRTIRVLASAIALVTLAACASPPVLPADDDLPAMLRAGPAQHLDQVLTARGQTVYECRRDGAMRLWAREGDLATLVDRQRQSVGTVAPGGYFTAYDSSYVVVRTDAVAQVTAGTPVWTRYVARRRPGSAMRTGRFTRTSIIQQVDTRGGLPSDALCEREGSTLLVPYGATYLIYSASAVAPSNAPARSGRIGAMPPPWHAPVRPANGTVPIPDH
ncbi:MAG: DUF3455 domain-containing protein [Burkholderia sp.]|jgi:hypothetical protein|nr:MULTISPECIES: DUF3455 domain-containing protein [Burkholderia]MCA3783287.1 DUF3455 domain-containing protein [Burkholderia sp.]MCA3786987.1 DUF3455 domain-containing protein [Burkholderia sp.]MCA3796195.1 DUF3455 domain-containing protein [Burkholderia sp.]MCA3801608.1 DUF3455 domain-containing protein [Burkholderia sp.]MCA3812301.1 DUF3455 domain-containing protein [Burkholderia sp.]